MNLFRLDSMMIYCMSIPVYYALHQYLPGAPRSVINPRRACAARVTVVVLCVCVCVCLCVQAAHLRLTQLSDKLNMLTDLVSCWLQNEFGVFRIMASFRR